MISDAPTQRNKTWEELASAASKETDPDEVATIAEEILPLSKSANEPILRSLRIQSCPDIAIALKKGQGI